MKIGNDKISNGQMLAIIVSTVIGVGILSLPRTLTESVGTDGWILLIISGLLVGVMVTVITIVTAKFPNKTVIEFGRSLLITPISDFISCLYFIYLIIFSAFVVRIFAEIVKMFLLARTPTEVIIITMLLATAYLSRAGIEAIGRVAVLILPIIILPILSMSIVLFQELDPTNIFPVFSLDISKLPEGILSSVFAFAGFDLLLLFMCFNNEPKKALKYNLIAVGIITIIYLTVFFTVIMAFGETETIHLLWPSMSLTELVQFPGAFIENVQGIVMAQWTLVVLTTLAPLIYGIALIISKLFRANEHSFFVLPTIPIIYILSLVPDNLALAYEYVGIATNYLGVFVIIIMPIVLFFITLLKKNPQKGDTQNG